MKKKVEQSERKWTYFFCGLGVGLSVAAIVIGFMQWLMPQPIALPAPTVKITALRFNSIEVAHLLPEAGVPYEITVIGQSQNLPNKSHLWICVFPTDTGRYYPQREPVQADANWELKSVYIGRVGSLDLGKRFIICAVLADEEATSILSRYAELIPSGIESLPSGAAIHHQVAVIRDR